MARIVRIGILLLILATVAQEAWLARSRAASWKDTLRVAVYPINGDGSAAAAAYLRGLPPHAFRAVEGFFDEEAKRYGRQLFRPIEIAVAPELTFQPPQPPRNANALESIVWSLRMRYWAWRHDALPGGMKPQVRLFVLFFDPAAHSQLPHSVGVARGMIGLVNAFATNAMAGSNQVVLAHELLHTLGATDKYDPASNLPLFPQGYADPERSPRHPQQFAEIMAGRIPLSDSHADTPESLDRALVGAATAAEIGWIGKP